MTPDTPLSLRQRLRSVTVNTATLATIRLSGPVERASQLSGVVRVPILMYHQIAESGPAFPWRVSPETFAAQMAWLADNEYRVIALREFLAGWHRGELPSRAVVLTFDDGHVGVLRHAVPVLERHRFPFALFLATGAVGTPEFPWLRGWLPETDPEEYRPMTWSEVKSLDSALVTLGSHSVTHPHLARINRAQLAWELAASRRMIEGVTGRRVWALAYPGGIERYGDHSFDTRDALPVAGYVCGLVSEIGRNGVDADPLRLRRLSIEAGDTVETFRAKVVGAYSAVRTLQWAGQRLFGDEAGY
jgi:peptidoglycan/xylan/chitin deacetylase (PgdA/CDA1 family)